MKKSASLSHVGHVLLNGNQTDCAYPDIASIIDIFEEKVRLYPDKIALIADRQTLTYQVMNKRVNQLAWYLRYRYQGLTEQRIKPGTCISLYMERGIDLIIAIIAILKAGAAYVPMDITYPEDRVRFMLEDTCSSLIITQSHFVSKLENIIPSQNIIVIDEASVEHESIDNLDLPIQANDLAYVIYTSGTTGQPKGVMIEHGAVVNFASSNTACDLSSMSVVGMISSHVFDGSIFDIFGSLLNGGRLVLLNKADYFCLENFSSAVDYYQIDSVFMTTALFNVLAEQGGSDKPLALKNLLFGGETSNIHRVKQFQSCYPEINLVNVYGPTETTVFATSYPVLRKNYSKIPIGKALANKRLYVLNDRLQPVDIGVVGELYIGGAGLARGYLNHATLTSEKFIDNPFATTEDIAKGYARLYKTGDQVYWLPNGNLQHVGRNDFQVKINGFRIELGEVEQALLNFPGISQSLVIVKELQGEKFLVAYYVAQHQIKEEEVRQKLLSVLPEYMLPRYIIKLDSFPLAITGKIDRKALPNPQLIVDACYVAPRNDIENRLCQLCADVLGLEKVGVEHGFLSLGGNSILAIKLTYEINKHFNIHLNVLDVLNSSCILDIKENILAAKNYQALPSNVATYDTALVNSSENMILTDHVVSESQVVYNESFVMTIPMIIEFDQFQQAVIHLMSSYEMLNVNYINREGIFYRQLNKQSLVDIEYFDLSGSQGLDKKFSDKIHALVQRKFNIEVDKLIRFYLFKINEQESRVFIVLFHAILDGTSMIKNILPRFYELLCPSQAESILDIKTLESFHQLNRKLEVIYSQDKDKKLDYWRDFFAHHQPCKINDLTGGKKGTAGKQATFSIDSLTKKSLLKLSADLGMSLFDILCGYFFILLHKLTQQNTLTICTNIDERFYCPEFSEVVGCCVNNLFLGLSIDSDLSVYDVLQKIKDHKVQGIKNLLSYNEFFKNFRNELVEFLSIVFTIEPEDNSSRDYLQSQIFTHSGHVKTDLYIELDVKNEYIEGRVEYKTSLFSDEFIQTILNCYQVLLKNSLYILDKSLGHINILEEEEYHKVINKFNENIPYNNQLPESLVRLFERQVEKSPDSIAMEYMNESLTYEALNQKANQVARYLRKRYSLKFGKELPVNTLIGLCVNRDCDLMIYILGILKAGAAYVPIDPHYPKERIRFMLEDMHNPLVITQNHLMEKFSALSTSAEWIVLDTEDYSAESYDNLENVSKGEDLAYVIYTSGTTGKPKGVMISQKNISHFLLQSIITFAKVHYHCLSLTNYVFDIFGLEYGLPLLTGGKLILSSVDSFIEDIQHHPTVNLIQQTPSVWDKLLLKLSEYHFKNDCLFLVGGEAVSQELIEKLLKYSSEVVNVYGPTETTIWSAAYRYHPNSSVQSNCIGRPLINEQIYILDQYLQPLPIGVPGEIYIGGIGLATGYLNKPELTQERFVSNPFKSGAYLYKTGDLAKWLPDGNIRYIGRNDFQVKIRGFRIELSEIERALLSFPGLKQCVVATRFLKNQQILVCYYVAEKGINQDDLKYYLLQLLPEYMLPSYFLALSDLPLTVNGKVDRLALPDPCSENMDDSYVPPTTGLEEKLCQVWQEVLSIPRVGIQDDFFSLGGNSILSLQLQHKMEAVVGRKIFLWDILESKTIQKFCLAHQHVITNQFMEF